MDSQAVRATNSDAGPIDEGDWIGIVRGDGIVAVSGTLDGATVASITTGSPAAEADLKKALELAPDGVRVNAIGPGPTLQGGRQTAEAFATQRAATVLLPLPMPPVRPMRQVREEGEVEAVGFMGEGMRAHPSRRARPRQASARVRTEYSRLRANGAGL